MFKNAIWKLPLVIVAAGTLSACAIPGGGYMNREQVSYEPPAPAPQPACASVNGSIYQCHSNRFLFEDLKARRVGDVLTIILQESTQSNKSASTSTTKDSGVSVAPPTIFGRGVTHNGKTILDTEISSGSNFSGSGDSSQSNSLQGSITVSVVQVLPNGNLVVRGEKTLTLNQGSEVVQVSGIVRATDITSANEVYSTQIANAKITYSGKGIVADSNAAGWATRFFHSKWWPL